MLQIEHTELSEKVYQLLRGMILKRDFVGGQKLDLNQLSSQMRISRTPLKDAINRLVMEGLMEVKSRSGTFISKITSDDIRGVMEIRLMIELWAISQLNDANAKLLAAYLRSNVNKSQQILNAKEFSYLAFLEQDIDFHKAIVKMNGNMRMIDMYHGLNSFLQISRVFFFKSNERSRVGQQEHEALISCLESFDLEQAKQKLQSHIENSMNTMSNLIIENGGTI